MLAEADPIPHEQSRRPAAAKPARWSETSSSKEPPMEDYIRCENQKIFKRHLETVKSETQRQLLLKLLAAEAAKTPVLTR
jgi:hypothetical protein